MTKAQAGRLGGLVNSGERNHQAKLTREQVDRIRLLRSHGVSLAELGAMFGVHPSHVSRVANRRQWK